MDRTTRTRAVIRFAAAILLVAIGWFGHALLHRTVAPARDRRVRAPRASLVSPLLDVELPEGYDVRREPIPFKAHIQVIVDRALATGRARQVSVYYRDLIDGPWFGIAAEAPYDPASLMKLPVMVAWLKRAERDPWILGRSLTFDAGAYPGGPQAIPPRKSLSPGGRYTVEELLEYMLSYSDNRAMWLLFRELGQEELGDVLDNMDVVNDPTGDGNAVTAHGYSGFLRILFNASYLGRDMSEYALRLLTAEDFSAGIQAGVPKGVTVAAKFGETPSARYGGTRQLHEFGIVYHPRGPYILGVMTEGDDLAAQAGIIREISAATYAEIESQAAGGPGGR
jgi:beta-lactamase class A